MPGSWWCQGVLYQVHPRSFADGNGDGIGDLVGLVYRLEYLEWLGFERIWFDPDPSLAQRARCAGRVLLTGPGGNVPAWRPSNHT